MAAQDSAADQVTVVGELVAVRRRLAPALLVVEVDCFAVATLAYCICLARENSSVGSKAFEAGCSFLRFVTCTHCWVDFYGKENKII